MNRDGLQATKQYWLAHRQSRGANDESCRKVWNKNAKKTKLMMIHHKQGEKVKTELNGQRIEEIEQFKYLGRSSRMTGDVQKRLA